MSCDPRNQRSGWMPGPAAWAIAVLLLPLSPGAAGRSAAVERSAVTESKKGQAKDGHPRIVKTSPRQGATGVSSDLKQISVTFDQDMGQGMSWTGGPPLFPPVDEARKARWIDKRTCVLPVKLQEGAFYRVGINSPRFQNFRGREGVPACTEAVYFSTKGATEEVEQRVRVPSIVSIEPENGAKDVDPATTMLRVTFNVPMDGGMSWMGGGTTYPKPPEGKKPSWSDDGLTCTLPVALEPDHDYQLSLNSATHKSFASKWGVPLEEVVYKFRTRSPERGTGGSSARGSVDRQDSDYPHTGLLYGRIVDENNKALEGVHVWPHSFEGKLAPLPDLDTTAPKDLGTELRALFSTTTNRYGDFCLSLRFAGDQLKVGDIEVSKSGFVHRLDKQRYKLVPDGQCRIEYALQPGEVLAGRVDPLIGGPVHWPSSDGDAPFSAVVFITGDAFDGWISSEAGGAFEVYVPPGTYTVSTHWAPGVKLTGIRSGTRDILIRRPSPAITKSESRRALQALWDDMDRHYSYFTIKPQVDWNKLRDEYLAKVEACETRDQFLFELAGLLRQLDDVHVWIKAGEETISTGGRGYHSAWNPPVVERQLTGLQVIGNLARIASVKDLGYAYVEVRALQATPEEVESLLAAMAERRDAPGFMVDMRRCFGGSEPIAQQIAQFFCDREIVYAKNKYRDGPGHDQFGEDLERRLTPAKDPYTQPVVCLIANGTMSSGDSFAQMLDALPHVVTVGERTRGSSGNPAPFTLPGLDVQVWYSRWFDMGPDGSVVEGVGVAPDILIDWPAGAYEEDADPIFARGLEVLRSRVGEN